MMSISKNVVISVVIGLAICHQTVDAADVIWGKDEKGTDRLIPLSLVRPVAAKYPVLYHPDNFYGFDYYGKDLAHAKSLSKKLVPADLHGKKSGDDHRTVALIRTIERLDINHQQKYNQWKYKQNEYTSFHQHAALNLRNWKEKVTQTQSNTNGKSLRGQNRGILDIIELYGAGNTKEIGVAGLGDWGAVTAHLTQKYGETFAVLNMANQLGFGGGYERGMIAQEENMFRRSDCHFSHIFRDPAINYKGVRGSYNEEEQNLIAGKDGEVYLDVEHPRVCITGPENVAETIKGIWTEKSYTPLPDDQIFPFYELRAAAQDMRGVSGDKKNLLIAKEENRKRIAAQINTLRKKGVKHVVLSAFGCGAFKNPASEVARLYKEEIERDFTEKGKFFEVIAFAIFYAGYGPKENYDEFKNVFFPEVGEDEETKDGGRELKAPEAPQPKDSDDVPEGCLWCGCC